MEVMPSGWPTRYECWDTKLAYESGQTLQQHEDWLAAVGPALSNTVLLAAAEGEKPGLGIEKIRGTVNPADLMTKHQHGKRLTTLCDLLNIKHISGRPKSALKLTIDTEYITYAKRAAVTLVRQAAARETAVSSRSESGEWIKRMDCWTSAEWMITVVVTVGILVYLVPT